MKTLLNISALGFLLIAASSPCFAMQENVAVSNELAKDMGVTIQAQANGEAGTKVWIEFKTQGVLKNFSRIELDMAVRGKYLVSAPLLTLRPTADSVSAYFSADPTHLASSVLTIVVQDGERTRTGYQFKVKDFIELQKSR